MKVIKAGEKGSISPLQQVLPVDCIVIGDGNFTVPNHATAYGYVISGTVLAENIEYQDQEYFAAAALEAIKVKDGTVMILIRYGYRGQRVYGGKVEGQGRAQTGHQCVQQTNLVVRHSPNDPGFVSKHLSRSAKVDEKAYPNPRFCVLVEGGLRVSAPQVSETLKPGDVFVLDAWEAYKIQTGDKPAVYLTFEAVSQDDI